MSVHSSVAVVLWCVVSREYHMLNMCVTGWMAIDLPATIDLREIQDFIFLVLLLRSIVL